MSNLNDQQFGAYHQPKLNGKPLDNGPGDPKTCTWCDAPTAGNNMPGKADWDFHCNDCGNPT